VAIARHDGHTFDADLVHPGRVILDVGCRGFHLAAQFPHCRYIGFDADPELAAPADLPNGDFTIAAVVGEHPDPISRTARIVMDRDTSARTIVRNAHQWPTRTVPTITLEEIISRWNILHFALIKLDCEGSEYGIMEVIAGLGPIADQISVEYHDFCGLNPQTDMDQWYATLHTRLGQWYDAVRFTGPIGDEPAHFDCLYQLRMPWRT